VSPSPRGRIARGARGTASGVVCLSLPKGAATRRHRDTRNKRIIRKIRCGWGGNKEGARTVSVRLRTIVSHAGSLCSAGIRTACESSHLGQPPTTIERTRAPPIHFTRRNRHNGTNTSTNTTIATMLSRECCTRPHSHKSPTTTRPEAEIAIGVRLGRSQEKQYGDYQNRGIPYSIRLAVEIHGYSICAESRLWH